MRGKLPMTHEHFLNLQAQSLLKCADGTGLSVIEEGIDKILKDII